MAKNYVNFYLSSPASVALLQCVELSHPAFSQVHRVVMQAMRGVTVKHEDGNDYTYLYYPLDIQQIGDLQDIDYGFKITFGDLEGRLQDEVDRVFDAGNFNIKPTCTFRMYRSDNLTAPLHGPLELEINELAFNEDGAQFDAVAPLKNVSATGRLYDLADFPQMRDFL